MKKLALGMVAVLAVAGVAMATPSLVLPSQIVIDKTQGLSTDVYVSIVDVSSNMAGNGAAGLQGVNVWLFTGEPFVLSNLVMGTTGMLFNGNNTGGSADYTNGPQIATRTMTTVDGQPNITADGILAKITITIPAGTPEGTTGVLSTGSDEYQTYSDLVGNPLGQASAQIVVTPEPAAALLLLAGLPILRRRHA